MDIVSPGAKSTEWRNVPGFSRYQVGNAGEVRRVHSRKGRIMGGLLAPNKDRFGYCRVRLINDENVPVTTSFHKLVAMAFIGEIPPGYEVNHKNLIKSDNRPENLEIITHHQNIIHSWETGDRRLHVARGERTKNAKLKSTDIPTIRELYKQGYTQREIASKYNVSHVTIGYVLRAKTWGHIEDEAGARETAAVAAILSDSDVREIRKLFHRRVSAGVIAEKYKISKSMVGDIVTWKKFNHVQQVDMKQPGSPGCIRTYMK